MIARRSLLKSSVVKILALTASVAGVAAWAGTGPRPVQRPQAPAAKPVIYLVRAADWMGHEWTEDAIRVGLQEADLEEGRDYEIKVASAQGDLATLPALLDRAVDAKAAVIVAIQDATLQVAVKRVKTTPVVFHLLADPFAAGAGKSDTDHLPNFTGVYSPGFGDPEQARRIDLIKRVVPAAKQIGIVFSPEEQLAVVFKDKTTAAAKKAGLTVATASVSTLADVGNATRSLCGKKVDAIEIFGNTAHSGFPELIKIARECKVPVFSPSPFEVMQGATAAIFPDFAEGGAVAGKMIGRILKGEKPATIPFFRIQTTRVAVNPGAASRAGATIPADLVKQADTVVGPR